MANTNTKTSTLNSNSKSSEKETKVTELSSVQKLKYFIGMYNIKGDTGSSSKDTKCVSPSVWKSDGKKLSVASRYDNVCLTTSVDTKFPKGEFGIQESGRLNKMLGCVPSDISVTKTSNQLKFNSGKLNFNYHLVNPESIDDGMDEIVEELSDTSYEASISLTKEDIETFLKVCSSFPSDLKESMVVKVWKNKGGNYYLDVFNTNSHKMSIPVTVENDELNGTITFNANSWVNIFSSNTKSNGCLIDFSDDGICQMVFSYSDEYSGFNSTYNVLPSDMIPVVEEETEEEDTSSEELQDTSDPKSDRIGQEVLDKVASKISDKLGDTGVFDVSVNDETLEPELVEGV